MHSRNSTAAKAARTGARRRAGLLYAALIGPAVLLAVGAGEAIAGPPSPAAFQPYNSANASTITPGPLALYTVSVNSLHPTQMDEGLAEVGKKAAGFDLLTPAQLPGNLITDIEPVVIGPGGQLYLTDGHHTFTALLDSIYGASNPTVYVNVIANYSGLTTSQFFTLMQSQNLLLPLNDGVPQSVNPATGAPLPTSLTGLTADPYRGLEYSILKNKSSKLFPTTSNITGAVGAATPGLDKMTGAYTDFLEAAAYRDANSGRGLAYLSPGDIALATQWNLTGTNVTSLPNVAGPVTVAQLPGFILSQNIVNAGGISNATLATGALDGNGGFTGITTVNLGTLAQPITVGTPNVGFVMELGADNKDSVTLDGTNTYTGGASILAGRLIVQSDASLGAAVPMGATINPTSVLASVQAANGIIFNSLTEGAGTLTLGTTTGGTFATSRPIAVGGEVATLDVNDNTVTLNGPIVSLGVNGVGIGNAAGTSDLTIDDLSGPANGTLILTQNSPNFYGNLIIGNSGTPTVRVTSDGELGNTSAAAGPVGEVELNGGTLQTGASFAAPERNLFLGGGSQIDVDGFTTSWGSITDVQRTLDILNSNATTAGAISFSSLTISSTATLQLAGGAAGESVTFTNGIGQTAPSDVLIINPSSASSLGTTEKVFSSGASATLTDGIAPAWIVTNNGAKKGVGPYDFVTYGANGYVKATYDSTATLNAGTAGDVVALSGNATLTGAASVFALNTEGKTVTVGANTLTLGDGVNLAGLILATGSQISGGTLAFGSSEGVIWLSGTNPVISSAIAGSNGLTFAGSGAVNLSTAANVSGQVTIDSGAVTLSAANVFSSDVSGVLLTNVKSHPAASTLNIAASNSFATLNSVGNNSTINITGGSILTIGDSNNLASTLSSNINDTTVTAGAITKNGSGLLDLSGATITLAAGSSIAANGGQLRVATGALKNTAVAGSAPNFVLAGGADLQFAQNGGGQYAGAISGAGTLHLIGGTLQLTGTANSYTGGTIVEIGSILDVTTANLPSAAPNITDAGGLIVFDQATTGTYAGVISDGKEMGTGPTLSGSLDKDDSSGGNTGDLILTSAQTYTGATTVEAGTLTLNAVDTLATSSGVDLGRVGGGSTAALALGANNTLQALTSEAADVTTVTLGANTLTLNTPTGINAAFGGVISGAGAVVKTGAGAEVFSGADVYSGGTTVQAGLLNITGSINSTGATTVTGGVLNIAAGGSVTTSATTVGGGALDVSGSLNSGTVAVTGGVLSIAQGGSATTTATTVGGGALDVSGSLNSGTVAVNGGTLDIANHGSVVTTTTTVNGGVLELDSGGTFSSTTSVTVGAGGTFFAAGGAAASVTPVFSNAGVLNIRNGAGTNVFTVGAYTGVAGSTLQVGANFTGKTADDLVVASAAGTTTIAVTDLTPTAPLAYNPTGLAVVTSTGAMSASAFTLATGPVEKGLFQYDLAYSPDPHFLLVSVPAAGAFRLSTLPTAAQAIWQDTAGVWLDRQNDERDLFAPGAGPAPGGAMTGVWARAVGDWTDRTQTQTYSLLNKTYNYQTGYNQTTDGIYAGYDGGVRGPAGRDDLVLFGGEIGYIDSTQKFKASSAAADYQGWSVGLSATYLNQNFFVDALFKGDFLELSYVDPSIAGFGASQQSGNIASYGGIIDAGYRFNVGDSAFIEPQATVADVAAHLDGLALAGSQVTFSDQNTVRGRLGVRGGFTLVDNSDVRIDASATGSYWVRLSGGAAATINSGIAAPLLTLADTQVKQYGEGGIGLNVFSKTSGLSGFFKGDYQFGSGYDAGSIKAGVRYDF